MTVDFQRNRRKVLVAGRSSISPAAMNEIRSVFGDQMIVFIYPQDISNPAEIERIMSYRGIDDLVVESSETSLIAGLLERGISPIQVIGDRVMRITGVSFMEKPIWKD